MKDPFHDTPLFLRIGSIIHGTILDEPRAAGQIVLLEALTDSMERVGFSFITGIEIPPSSRGVLHRTRIMLGLMPSGGWGPEVNGLMNKHYDIWFLGKKNHAHHHERPPFTPLWIKRAPPKA